MQEEILKKFKIGDENMSRIPEMLARERKQMQKEARAKGISEGKIEIIKNMLKEKFSINTITTISGMNEKEIERIAKKMS